jgi:hypothetical protein
VRASGTVAWANVDDPMCTLLCVQVFNQETFMLSHGSYNGSKVGVRVMDYMQWVNSKVFFFSQRSAFFPGRPTPAAQLPVMVHMNYQ